MSIQFRSFGVRGLRGLLLALLVSVPAVPAAAGEVSAVERSALLEIARSHPSAAAVLLFIDRETPSGSSGKMYFEGFPSVEALRVLLDKKGGAELDAPVLLLPFNPYSSETGCLVEVRWILTRRNEATVLISTRSQLVDRQLFPLQPAHLLETPVTVVAADGTFSVRGQVTGVSGKAAAPDEI